MRFLSSRRAFTLIELLVVMTIILILAGLVLGNLGPMQEKGRRSRAQTEIRAMETALESYKVDNGAYPTSSTSATSVTFPNPRIVPSSFVAYQSAATVLYQSLSGRTTNNPSDLATNKIYMEFKLNQIDPTTRLFAVDPWRNAYGYSYAQSINANGPFYDPSQQLSYNTNAVDLWSTCGLDPNTGLPNAAIKWVSNWAN